MFAKHPENKQENLHPAFWPIKDHFGVQLSEFINVNANITPNHKITSENYFNLGHEIFGYLFSVCDATRQSRCTKFHSVHLLQQFLQSIKEPILWSSIQLYSLGSLFIVSKYFERKNIRLEELMKYSLHQYTKKDIMDTEAQILKAMDFSICKREIFTDKLSLYLEIVENFLPSHLEETFFRACFDISELIYEANPNKVIKVFPNGILAASVINAVNTILSKTKGKDIPITKKLAYLCESNEENLISASDKIIRMAIGKKLFYEYDF